MTQAHKFEEAGLGKAPFKFVGVRVSPPGDENGMIRIASHDGIETWTKRGGSCAYCMTYITTFCDIESADGKHFHVGSECVAKTGDAGLIKKAKTAVSRARAEKKHARDAARITAARAKLTDESVRAQLSAQPHPLAWRASKGDTLLDWAEWMMECAGTRGRLQVCKAVESL